MITSPYGLEPDMYTVCKLLQSEDWKDRVVGEYWFLFKKLKNLRNLIDKYSLKKLNFKPNCSLELLLDQYNHMQTYLTILEVRSNIENIDLSLKNYECESNEDKE